MKELIVTIVGVSTVFLIFGILYVIFVLMAVISKNAQKKAIKLPKVSVEEPTHIPEIKKQEPQQFSTETTEEEEVAAIFGAIYSMLGENVKVLSVKPAQKGLTIERRVKGERGWEEWRTSTWRGGNRW